MNVNERFVVTSSLLKKERKNKEYFSISWQDRFYFSDLFFCEIEVIYLWFEFFYFFSSFPESRKCLLFFLFLPEV